MNGFRIGMVMAFAAWQVLAGLPVPAKAGEVIQSAAEVRRLDRGSAATGHRVKLTGVVNWAQTTGRRGAFTLEDGTGSIFVEIPDAALACVWRDESGVGLGIGVGVAVEVSGVTSSGGYAPVVVPDGITIRGAAALRTAPLRTLGDLGPGQEDAQRVQLEPLVVQAVVPDPYAGNRRLLRVGSRSGFYGMLTVPKAAWNDPELLVDAEVGVIGVVLTLYNSRVEATGVRVGVCREEDLKILTPAPADPFGGARVEIGALRLFDLKGGMPHRRVLQGTVSYASGDLVVLQSNDRAVQVRTTEPGGLQPGDEVVASGFVEAGLPVAVLTRAIMKKVGEASLPEPVEVTRAHLLAMSADNVWRGAEGLPADFDSRLVRLRGVLLASSPAGDSGLSFTLQLASGETMACLLRRDGGGPLSFPLGSTLEVTGVASFDYQHGFPLPELVSAREVSLLLRDEHDIRMLAAPPWWGSRETIYLLLVLGVALAGALLAVGLLRQKVRRQAGRLENALRTHRDAELEHEGAKRERLRLAGDLHDGVQQLLGAASYRLETAAVRAGADSSRSLSSIIAAQAAVDRGRRELTSVMWGVYELAHAPSSFPELLEQALGRMDHWPEDGVRIVSSGDPEPLPPRTVGSLLLLVQEAVSNAFQHGRATRVTVGANFRAGELEMVIADNGSGFDPALVAVRDGYSGMGLPSMRRRAADVAASFKLTSAPGSGTTVQLVLPTAR